MAVRLEALSDALTGLLYLTRLDLSELAKTLDSRLIDGIENGKAQKFEYTMELCWKAIKDALREQEGLDEASPKKVIKAWYLTGHLTQDDYADLLQAIDDRNRLSHVYDEKTFRDILTRITDHAELLERISTTLKSFG